MGNDNSIGLSPSPWQASSSPMITLPSARLMPPTPALEFPISSSDFNQFGLASPNYTMSPSVTGILMSAPPTSSLVRGNSLKAGPTPTLSIEGFAQGAGGYDPPTTSATPTPIPESKSSQEDTSQAPSISSAAIAAAVGEAQPKPPRTPVKSSLQQTQKQPQQQHQEQQQSRKEQQRSNLLQATKTEQQLQQVRQLQQRQRQQQQQQQVSFVPSGPSQSSQQGLPYARYATSNAIPAGTSAAAAAMAAAAANWAPGARKMPQAMNMPAAPAAPEIANSAASVPMISIPALDGLSTAAAMQLQNVAPSMPNGVLSTLAANTGHPADAPAVAECKERAARVGDEFSRKRKLELEVENTGGAKKPKIDKRPEEMTKEELKKKSYSHRLFLNRQSAAVSRVRRQAYVKFLEESLTTIERTKYQQENQIGNLRDENSKLKAQLQQMQAGLMTGKGGTAAAASAAMNAGFGLAGLAGTRGTSGFGRRGGSNRL